MPGLILPLVLGIPTLTLNVRLEAYQANTGFRDRGGVAHLALPDIIIHPAPSPRSP